MILYDGTFSFKLIAAKNDLSIFKCAGVEWILEAALLSNFLYLLSLFLLVSRSPPGC
jgi:hypothetical protein